MKEIVIKRVILLVIIFIASNTYSQNKLVVFSLDANALKINKQKVLLKDTTVMPAVKQLLKEADNALQLAPMSVMEKKNTPPSGDKHDYMSLAPYFWPDPNKPDGIPYIRKDGQVNPEVEEYKDKEYLPVLCRVINTLSLAYYFTDDNKYAEKSAKLIKVWFLDSATKMNPNLNFGQAVKGVNDGRGAGIIDTRGLMKVVDAIGFLRGTNFWSEKDQQEMVKWITDYLQWLRTSKNGIDEKKTKNNHAIWYDAQCLSFALFIGNTSVAKEIVLSVQNRLEYQMDNDGFFPAELDRTISLHYSVFILDPLFNIAQMSSVVGIDMWNYTSKSGKSIKKAFEALLPYISKEKDWEGQQIKPFDFQVGIPLLAQGISKLKCITCKESIYNIAGEKSKKLLFNLINNID